eukprot:237044-Prorocentrum_minimum.AAC.1
MVLTRDPSYSGGKPSFPGGIRVGSGRHPGGKPSYPGGIWVGSERHPGGQKNKFSRNGIRTDPVGYSPQGLRGNMWILRGELQSLISDCCRVEGYLRASDCGL